jgi:pimeloyl-ACP methyl ester carboxylesterase
VLDLSPRRLSRPAKSQVLLVVGPSLGTSAASLWGRTASRLRGVEVLGWDLPGHGNAAPASAPFTVDDVVEAVLTVAGSAAAGRPVHYAGVSLGGAVGLALALRPGAFASVASLCAAPKIGLAQAWQERAQLVRREGTAAVVEGSRERWFAPGFADEHPGVADVLLDGLRAADATSYALACEALATFDLTERMPSATTPLLAVTGEHDPVVSAEQVRRALPAAEHAVLPGCGHLPPAEQPHAVATLLSSWITRGDVG